MSSSLSSPPLGTTTQSNTRSVWRGCERRVGAEAQVRVTKCLGHWEAEQAAASAPPTSAFPCPAEAAGPSAPCGRSVRFPKAEVPLVLVALNVGAVVGLRSSGQARTRTRPQ